MFVVRNLLDAIAGLADTILTLYVWVLVGRVVISWVGADRYNPIVQTICRLTDPLLDRLRRTLPMYIGGIDLSPLVAMFVIWFLQRFVVRSLYDLAQTL